MTLHAPPDLSLHVRRQLIVRKVLLPRDLGSFVECELELVQFLSERCGFCLDLMDEGLWEAGGREGWDGHGGM